MFDDKFKPQHNARILSLQFCRTVRQSDESAEGCMGILREKAMGGNHQDKDRRLNEQVINSINDKAMAPEIIKKLIIIEGSSEVTRHEVLSLRG